MLRHLTGIAALVLFPGILGITAVCSADGPAHHWIVNADGTGGTLDLTTGADGRVRGTLSGRPVEGRLVGRRLVLIRNGAGGPESWEAWLASPKNIGGESGPMLAGTFVRPGDDQPLPWFGTPAPFETGAGTIPLPVPLEPATPESSSVGGTEKEERPAPIPSPASIEPEPVQAVPSTGNAPMSPLDPSGRPVIAGTWETPDGPLTIRQEGSKLVFVLPDREVSGRLTGSETLVGGFGPGCCKGRLEQAFAVIAWDNGIRWFRK